MGGSLWLPAWQNQWAMHSQRDIILKINKLASKKRAYDLLLWPPHAHPCRDVKAPVTPYPWHFHPHAHTYSPSLQITHMHMHAQKTSIFYLIHICCLLIINFFIKIIKQSNDKASTIWIQFKSLWRFPSTSTHKASLGIKLSTMSQPGHQQNCTEASREPSLSMGKLL